MNNANWILKPFDDNIASMLSVENDLFPLTARLLAQRGITTTAQAELFLGGGWEDLWDPFLLKDMDKAVSRIKDALANGERICIYGDYDVDGVTATTTLYKYLSGAGADCGYFIPDRLTDGYGLNAAALKNLAERFSLIITVDTGVTAIEEAQLAKSLGVDIIITDHHSCRDVLPDVVAVVNPQRQDDEYPFKNLAGVGVVFKLLCALEGDAGKILDTYGDLVALGTVADVMPLIGENRIIVREGMKSIAALKNKGLAALMKCTGVIKYGRLNRTVNTATLGFVIAPKLNAAGRIAKAEFAASLLLCEDEVEADRLATELCEINKQRQEIELSIFESALEQIPEQINNPILVCGSEGWHQGVVGIVASRIAERYARPCVLLSYENGVAKGSARSVRGISVIDALTQSSDILSEYGGHEFAAGLTINSSLVPELTQRLCTYVNQIVSDKPVRILEIDLECEIADITVEAVKQIINLEPFGNENNQPLFLVRKAILDNVTPVGNAMHVKLAIMSDDKQTAPITAMCFGVPMVKFELRQGDVCDIAFAVDINAYGGNTTAQLIVKAIRRAESNSPDLTEFRQFYRLLKSRSDESGSLSLEDAPLEWDDQRMNLMLEVLEEQNLIEYTKGEAQIKLLPFSGKINLKESKILGEIST